MVGGIEVGEIDPMKGFDVGADRLRVVQCRGDQVVKVDELDVECLTHMEAAVAQNMHHLDAILHRVEMRLHRTACLAESLY